MDDHALIRDSITALLSLQHDMQVVGVAENGREALAKLAELHPDVVVMDLRMPEMNGLEATREICCEPHHAKVLMLSQYDDEENVIASKEAGAWDLMPKQSASGRAGKRDQSGRPGSLALSGRGKRCGHPRGARSARTFGVPEPG